MAVTNMENLNNNVLGNLKELIRTETVIGDPIAIQGTTIIPVCKATFGFGAGGTDLGKTVEADKFGGGSGAGVTVTPVAFLVVREGHVQLLQLADKNNTADRVVNMVPDVVDKISCFCQGDKGEKVPPAADPVPDPSL